MASACELLLRFARPSARLEGRDVELVEKICVLSEDFLQMEARSFIVESSDNTLLLWYACDSTPLKVRRSYRRKVNLLEVHRSGKGCVDYLVQRCYSQNNTGPPKRFFYGAVAAREQDGVGPCARVPPAGAESSSCWSPGLAPHPLRIRPRALYSVRPQDSAGVGVRGAGPRAKRRSLGGRCVVANVFFLERVRQPRRTRRLQEGPLRVRRQQGDGTGRLRRV